MASKVKLKSGWQIKWREGGRDSRWQVEFFETDRDAAHFKIDVEAAGNTWPDGWVPGVGYATPDEVAQIEAEEEVVTSNCTPFVGYATKRIERLLAARRIGEDQYGRYKGYTKAFGIAVPLATQLAEHLAEDDELRVETLVDPTSAAGLLASLEIDTRDLCIEDVDRDLIANWVTYMRVNGASPKTIRNHHGFLHGVFEQAFDEGLLPRNPCRKTELAPAEPLKQPVVLERPEFAKIYALMKPDFKDFIEVAVGTGMRFGELTAVTCADWDSEGRVLTVDKAWKKGLRGYKVGDPKTKAGKRQVWVGQRLATLLDKRTIGLDSSDLIFTAPMGGRIRSSVFSEDRWLPAVRAADIGKQPRFHDLRHTCISWMRDAGLHDAAIKELVGHTDEAMTGHYGSVTSETIALATQAMDRALTML